MIPYHKWRQIMKFPDLYEHEFCLAFDKYYNKFAMERNKRVYYQITDSIESEMFQRAHNRIAWRKKLATMDKAFTLSTDLTQC